MASLGKCRTWSYSVCGSLLALLLATSPSCASSNGAEVDDGRVPSDFPSDYASDFDPDDDLNESRRPVLANRVEARKAPDFADYPIDGIFTGEPAKLIISEDSSAGRFRQRLQEALQQGVPRFAGNFAVANLECGGGCESAAIVDLRTGSPTIAPSSAFGYDYRVDSRLLVVNPIGEDDAKDREAHERPRYYLWRDGSFEELPVR